MYTFETLTRMTVEQAGIVGTSLAVAVLLDSPRAKMAEAALHVAGTLLYVGNDEAAAELNSAFYATLSNELA